MDWHVVALALVVILVGLIRLRLLATPFERDEGEYAYMGRVILDGGLPYRDANNMKLPGTYAMYALVMALFGGSPTAIHAGLAIVSLATVVLLYLAFRRLVVPPAAFRLNHDDVRAFTSAPDVLAARTVLHRREVGFGTGVVSTGLGIFFIQTLLAGIPGRLGPSGDHGISARAPLAWKAAASRALAGCSWRPARAEPGVASIVGSRERG